MSHFSAENCELGGPLGRSRECREEQYRNTICDEGLLEAIGKLTSLQVLRVGADIRRLHAETWNVWNAISFKRMGFAPPVGEGGKEKKKKRK